MSDGPKRVDALLVHPDVKLVGSFGSLDIREDARVGDHLRVCVTCEAKLLLSMDAFDWGQRRPVRLGYCRDCRLLYVLAE